MQPCAKRLEQGPLIVWHIAKLRSKPLMVDDEEIRVCQEGKTTWRKCLSKVLHDM